MQMKVLQINAVYKNGGSTGRIVYDLKGISEQLGIESYVAFGYEYQRTHDKNTYKIESIPELKFSILETRMFGRHGFYNIGSTKKLIRWISAIKPDLIHLHNLHCHYMNVDILFNYIKEQKIPVVWTLHDCWSFTGWCAHFDYAGCEKWKTHCDKCELKHSYPFTWFFDRSSELYDKKKKAFCGVDNLTIVTPSQWLANKVKDSYLRNYPVRVINNGIDLNIFKPTNSSFRKDYNLEGQKIVLAIANGFTKNKGIDFILKLPENLPATYTVMIVGANPAQCKGFNGIVIERTNDTRELAKIYSAADVFINPTLEDTFPTTNLESLACGTPVITYQTGGSPESIITYTGIVVEKGNEKEFIHAILDIVKDDTISYACRNHALQSFDKKERYNDYINLYKTIINDNQTR